MQHDAMHEIVPDPRADTLDDLNERWAAILGPMPPGFERIPDEVVLRAGDDERFARYLAESRQNPSLLALLFADPKNREFRSAPDVAAEPLRNGAAHQSAKTAKPISTAGLVAHAATSLAKWAATAFENVDQAEAERRLVICRGCPHVESIDTAPMLTRLISSETAICGRCGCPLGRKARMASGGCPDVDPQRPGFNRWGQPHGA